MSEFDGGNDSAAEAAASEAYEVLAEAGIDIGQNAGPEEAAQEAAPAQPDPAQYDQLAEARRNYYRTRQEERQQRGPDLSPVMERVSGLERTLQQMVQVMQQQQAGQTPKPKTYDSLDPDFLELTQRQQQALIQSFQQELAPIKQKMILDEQERLQRIEHERRQQASSQAVERVRAEVAAYAQENPEYTPAWNSYAQGSYNAFLEMGCTPEQATSLVNANAHGIFMLARQLGANVGYVSHTLMRHTMGQPASAPPRPQNAQVRGAARAQASGLANGRQSTSRAGGGNYAAQAIRERGGLSRGEAAQVMKGPGGLDRLMRVAAAVEQER